MLLSRKPRGGSISREALQTTFRQFAEGQWEPLIQFTRHASEVASDVMVRRRRRRAKDDTERKAARAQVYVQMGELSSGRAALDVAEVAPRSENPTRRPRRPREPIPVHLLEHVPPDQVELDEEKVRGGGGPSGMTSKHLRILLENVHDGHLVFLMGQQLAQAVAPDAATQAMRLGRLTALRKADGGIRGIVANDVVRRLVSRTITQQFSDAALAATSPFQYALSTRAGCECISHALQSLTELDSNATILSIDGIGAFDLVSRGAMLQGLANLCPTCGTHGGPEAVGGPRESVRVLG